MSGAYCLLPTKQLSHWHLCRKHTAQLSATPSLQPRRHHLCNQIVVASHVAPVAMFSATVKEECFFISSLAHTIKGLPNHSPLPTIPLPDLKQLIDSCQTCNMVSWNYNENWHKSSSEMRSLTWLRTAPVTERQLDWGLCRVQQQGHG